jgi:hypothetical protein
MEFGCFTTYRFVFVTFLKLFSRKVKKCSQKYENEDVRFNLVMSLTFWVLNLILLDFLMWNQKSWTFVFVIFIFILGLKKAATVKWF